MLLVAPVVGAIGSILFGVWVGLLLPVIGRSDIVVVKDDDFFEDGEDDSFDGIDVLVAEHPVFCIGVICPFFAGDLFEVIDHASDVGSI